MSVKVFVDTKVLVYAFDAGEPTKQAIAQAAIAEYGERGALVLSTQVLQEFFVATTRKLADKLPLAVAYQAVEYFGQFPLVSVDLALILAAITRLRKTQLSFWDSLIVEAALHAGCSTLLTEDMQLGQRLGPLSIHNPFAGATEP